MAASGDVIEQSVRTAPDGSFAVSLPVGVAAFSRSIEIPAHNGDFLERSTPPSFASPRATRVAAPGGQDAGRPQRETDTASSVVGAMP
ncbi:hypothetical protein ACFQZC_20545 [Streptacidiphilus monticola]